jgi:hypothetical protein
MRDGRLRHLEEAQVATDEVGVPVTARVGGAVSDGAADAGCRGERSLRHG